MRARTLAGLTLAVALCAAAPPARAAGCRTVASAYRATLDAGRLPPVQGTPEWCAAARRLLPALDAFLAAAGRSPGCDAALMAPLQSGHAAHVRAALASCPP